MNQIEFQVVTAVKPIRVLVMDDEPLILDMSKKILAHLGYEASVAREGGEAIRLFQEAQATGEAFKLVILDLTVQRGMGGREAMEHLLQIDPSIAMIICSGYNIKNNLPTFEQSSSISILPKPYTIGQLNNALHTVLA